MNECKFCHNKFITKSSLNKHEKYAKYCISARGKQSKQINFFSCEGCHKKFTSKHAAYIHEGSCVDMVTQKYVQIIGNLTLQLKEQKDHYEKTISILQDKLENIAIKAVQQPFEENTYIDMDIDNTISDSEFTIHDSDSDTDEEEYQLSELDIGKGYSIEHRTEDGYINVTNLCKAGGKKFAGWKRLIKTKAFLQVLSTEVQIHTSGLIEINKGGNEKNNQETWVHPQIAINIAQWISPRFDVKVSAWVYEAMMTGKVDIANTKTYREIQQENKAKNLVNKTPLGPHGLCGVLLRLL